MNVCILILMSDPMKYTMEQLVKSLVEEGVEEIITDESDKSINVIINLLLCELEAQDMSPGNKTDRAETIQLAIDRYNYYPANINLLETIEQIMWDRYKEDPRKIISLAVKFLDSATTNEWFKTSRKYK